MAVRKRTGLTKNLPPLTPAASTLFTTNCFVKFDGSGNVTPSTSSDATILGVYTGPTFTSAGSGNAPILIEVPVEKAVEFTVDVEAGTVTAAMVGTTVDLNDATGVNVGGTSHNPVTITEVVSTTGGASSLGQVAVVIKGVLN
jgi:hypothetical protein